MDEDVHHAESMSSKTEELLSVNLLRWVSSEHFETI
jgi:hypothetical protein